MLYGSPQWQIEAFRRLEIPADMQRKHGFAPLGAADGVVKNKIFGLNSAGIYNLPLTAEMNKNMSEDRFVQIQREYAAAGGLNDLRDNLAHGFIAKRSA